MSLSHVRPSWATAGPVSVTNSMSTCVATEDDIIISMVELFICLLKMCIVLELVGCLDSHAEIMPVPALVCYNLAKLITKEFIKHISLRTHSLARSWSKIV